MQTPAEQKAIVQRMIDAGESEENIATVIRHFDGATAPQRTDVQASGAASVGASPNTALSGAAQGTGTTLEDRVRFAASQGNEKAKQLMVAADEFAKGEQRFNHAAPMIAATMATGGMAGIPAVIAAAGAGTAAQLADDSTRNMSMFDRLMSAAKSGGVQGLTQGVGEAVSAAAPVLTNAAKSLWAKTAKITEPVAKTTQTMRMGGTLADAKDEIATTVLDKGLGALSKSNAGAMRDSIDTLDGLLSSAISGSTKTIKRDVLQQALLDESNRVGVGTLAQETQQKALADAFDASGRLPANIPVQLAQKIKQQIYAARNYAAGASDAAAASADKVTGRALRSEIAAAEPSVAPINARLSKEIPALKAMDKALSRTSNRDAIGLSQMLAGVVTSPLTVASALINHPSIGSFTAQRIYDAAKLLPKDGRTVANIMRAAQMMAMDDK